MKSSSPMATSPTQEIATSIWRVLKPQNFWDKKKMEEITCVPILIDFSRLLSSHFPSIKNEPKTDWLFATIALFGSSLVAMESEELYSTITKKSVKTLILMKQKIGHEREMKPIEETMTHKEEISCDSPSAMESISSELNENPIHSNVKMRDEKDEQLGEFDGIFSDSCDDDSSSETESDEADNFIYEFKEFVEKVRKRKKDTANAGEKIEDLLVAAMTFDRSYSLPDEVVCHLLLVAVRKKYRNCTIGRFLIDKLKDPSFAGFYDVLLTYAEENAVDFFKKNGFIDDSILASKYRKVGENWLNSTPMCFVPPFTSTCLSGYNEKSLVDQRISAIEEQIDKWKIQQTSAYQNQILGILRLTQQLKSLKDTVEKQEKMIEHLKNENLRLRQGIQSKDESADVLIKGKDENEIKWEFTQQMLMEKSTVDVDVIGMKKATVSPSYFDSKLSTLADPLMYADLYYCGGKSAETLERILKSGFSKEDLEENIGRRGLHFSQSPINAIEFAVPGFLLLCTVGLGNTKTILKEAHLRTSAPDGYDSVLTMGRQICGNESVASEYIIYDTDQALPIFLIEYNLDSV